MKRIKAACICQTLHFMLKDDLDHEEAVSRVRQEVEHYRRGLEKNHTKYKIVSEQEEDDGSVILEIIKQYNVSPVGKYLD